GPSFGKGMSATSGGRSRRRSRCTSRRCRGSRGRRGSPDLPEKGRPCQEPRRSRRGPSAVPHLTDEDPDEPETAGEAGQNDVQKEREQTVLTTGTRHNLNPLLGGEKMKGEKRQQELTNSVHPFYKSGTALAGFETATFRVSAFLLE